MPEYFIPLQDGFGREQINPPVVLPITLHDSTDALAQLPDGDYYLIRVVADEDGKPKSASLLKKQKRVKTPNISSKVSEV